MNPSDRVTMRAPSFAGVAIATIWLGQGLYGARPIDHDGPSVPLFVSARVLKDWLDEHFPGAAFGQLLEAHRADVAATLESFVTGPRNDFEAAIAAIDDESKRAAFVADWEDRHRSSLNAITTQAHGLAARLRDDAAEQPR